MSDWSILKQRAAGKWQFPLLLFSLLMLFCAFWRVTPDFRAPASMDAVSAMESLVSAGFYGKAIDLGEKILLHADKSYRNSDLGVIRRHLARAHFGDTQRSGAGKARAGKRIIELLQEASSSGSELDAMDLVRLGRAHEWLRDYATAYDRYSQAVAKGLENASDLRRHIIELNKKYLNAPAEELDASLDDFLATVDPKRLDLVLWAIEQKIDSLDDLGELRQASTLLVRYEASLGSGEYRDRFDYLKALVLYKTGYYDESERLLRAVRNRADPSDEVHAMTGWLLGRAVLSDGEPQRPQEALAFFADVIMHHPESRYALASRVGQAEAYYYLDRHDDAIGTLRIVMEDIDRLRENPLVDLDVLLTSLSVMIEAQRLAGNSAESLDYARLAKELAEYDTTAEGMLVLQQLVQALEVRAEALSREKETDFDGSAADWTMAPTTAARRVYGEAADIALDLARRTILKEDRAAAWQWRAGEFLTRAGRREDAVRLYTQFAAERPSHSFLPRAMLRIGQLNHAMGRLQEAVEAYQACYRRFPRTLDGARALVPLAECYLALGPGNEPNAEKTLRIVLEDSDVFTPQAPEFADAMFLLGDILTRRNEFEQAIATMEEALERFPDDPRVGRTRFLLADAYRRSALALNQEAADAEFAGQVRQMQQQATERFGQARRLYREMIVDFESRGRGSLNRLERTYYRHAMLYEADCHFETQDYRQALKLYEEAVALFKNTPSGLAAYVQIINCHVFLGQPHEARAALARAEILVDSIPEAAFQGGVSPETRSDWVRYFHWLTESELF